MKAVLRDLVAQDDSEIDLAEAALVLASFDHPAADLEVYRDHLRALAKAVADAADEQGLDADAAPEDIADIVAFLASDDSRWLTGHTIPATGGAIASASTILAYA